jgi:hypothetical protein
MKTVFGFCLRFFCSFVAAKLMLRAFDADSVGYLIGLSLLFTLNLYWFDLSKYSDRFQPWWANDREQKDKAAGGPLRLPFPRPTDDTPDGLGKLK